MGRVVMYRRIWQGTLLLVGLLCLFAGCGYGAGGRETTLAALQTKTLALTVYWRRASSSDPTRMGQASLALGFADVGKWEGDACPIVHASATFGGVVLNERREGGATHCAINDDPACGQQCGNVEWLGDVTTLLQSLPATVDVVVRERSGEAVVTVRNPAPMATVQVLDLVEGQQVHNGDSFHVQLQPQPPATLEDVQAGFYVTLIEGVGELSLPASPDLAAGIGVWRVDVLPQQLPAGAVTILFSFGTSNMQFDSCPSDFTCSGISGVDFGEFALQYVP